MNFLYESIPSTLNSLKVSINLDYMGKLSQSDIMELCSRIPDKAKLIIYLKGHSHQKYFYELVTILFDYHIVKINMDAHIGTCEEVNMQFMNLFIEKESIREMVLRFSTRTKNTNHIYRCLNRSKRVDICAITQVSLANDIYNLKPIPLEIYDFLEFTNPA